MYGLIRNQHNFLKYGHNTNIQVYSKLGKYSTTRYYYRATLTKNTDDDGRQIDDMNYAKQWLQLQSLSKRTSMPSFELQSRLLEALPKPSCLRYIHMSSVRFEKTSSKVEVTVQTMKDKQKEKVEEQKKEAASTAGIAESKIHAQETTFAAPVKSSDLPKAVEEKKSLKTRIWEECLHYYHGFRLLFIDINVCRKLLWRVLNGKTLTRRENNLLVRTTSDLFRLIPFSVFIIVPFMELLLPVFIKFFPGMLPSTFQTSKERENKLKQSLQVRLEMAKFLQKTLDEMTVQHEEHKSKDAKDFAIFFDRIKNPNEYVSSEDIIKFAKSFKDELTLDLVTRQQLVALCRLLELNTIGTSNFLRFQLRLKLRSLAADDRTISREGIDSLDLFELQNACKARGMRAYGLTEERLRYQLQEWIELSLNQNVPPILLLLSRALINQEVGTTTDHLKETIRVLPEAVATHAKAAIGESEGKIDNKTKIEIIKEEERKIKEEQEEQREEQKKQQDQVAVELTQKELPPIAAPQVPLQTVLAAKEAPQPCAEPPAGIATAIKKEGITSKDVELLSEALKNLTSDTNKLSVEKETIKEIKEELADYKEDVQELHEVRNEVHEPVRESRAAKLLFNKVNKMINKLDKVLEDLDKQHKTIADTVQQDKTKNKEGEVPKEMIHITELVDTIKRLQQTSDDTRLTQIEAVLSKLDADKDGVITMNEVIKVVETIVRENVNLDEKQIEELLALLEKEQMIMLEEKIEKALQKSIKEAEQKASECDLVDKAPELKDQAPQLHDKALDLSDDVTKNVITTETSKEDKATLKAIEEKEKKILPDPDDVGDSTPTSPIVPSSQAAPAKGDKVL